MAVLIAFLVFSAYNAVLPANKTLGEEDVTLQYVDIESRLEALRVEQERLLALL